MVYYIVVDQSWINDFQYVNEVVYNMIHDDKSHGMNGATKWRGNHRIPHYENVGSSIAWLLIFY